MVFNVVVGRFQIFTIGHLRMLEEVRRLSVNSNLVIVLGSAQESGTAGNPFSADERETIIGPALNSAGISAQFRRINDVGNYPVWARRLVEEVIGTDDIIVYGGEDSSALKACAGIGIRTVPLENYYKDSRLPKKRISAGYVGDLICANNPKWMECVPREIAVALMTDDGHGKTRIDKIKEARRIIC